jgi:hypothetical protein
MPLGWVHHHLASGNAVVMVDGVDEVGEARRDNVRKWIKELTDTFPNIRLIVTSRPYAVEEGWLEADGFGEADLQPMDIASIEKFIDHWHKAVAEEVQQEQEVARLTTLAQDLRDTLRSNRAIRRLATSPLLCGVICALHRDTNEQLPEDRVELYERCCSMLLERRDPESGLSLGGYPRLTHRQKRALLDDLAYWMIKNEWTEVSIDAAAERFGKKLENLRTETKDGIAVTADNVLAFFLERSGMLRQPVEGKLDFAHRTFQEFMAAQAAVDEGDIGVLATNARKPQWREVIILGAGLARPRESYELITSLLTNGDKDSKDRYQLHLLAAACMETAVDLDTAIKTEVENRVRKLVPPTTMSQANLLADAAGDVAVPFLKRNAFLNAQKTAACVRALRLIGSLEALQAVAQYADDDRFTVLREVARAADSFDADSYGQVVVPRIDVSLLPADAAGEMLVRFDARRLKGLDRLKAVELTNPLAETLLTLRELPALESLVLLGADVIHLDILRGLTNLTRLGLKRTHVADLSVLRDLVDLHTLELELPINSPDLATLGALDKLTTLELKANGATDLAPLKDMTNLRALYLSGSGITDLSQLKGAVPNVETLSVWNIGDIDLSALTGFANLRTLSLSGTIVGDLSPLSGLTKLRSLALWGSGISQLAPLEGLCALESLTLSGVSIKNLSPLRGLTKLISLTLWSTEVDDLSPLRDLPDLRWIEAAYSKVDPAQIKSFATTNKLTIKLS